MAADPAMDEVLRDPERMAVLRDHAGTQFDARVVDILIDVIGERPARARKPQAVATR